AAARGTGPAARYDRRPAAGALHVFSRDAGEGEAALFYSFRFRLPLRGGLLSRRRDPDGSPRTGGAPRPVPCHPAPAPRALAPPRHPLFISLVSSNRRAVAGVRACLIATSVVFWFEPCWAVWACAGSAGAG